MHIKNWIFVNFLIFNVCLYTEEAQIKPLKNNIMSSIAKNPIASAKKTYSTFNLTDTAPSQSFAAVNNLKQEDKNISSIAKNTTHEPAPIIHKDKTTDNNAKHDEPEPILHTLPITEPTEPTPTPTPHITHQQSTPEPEPQEPGVLYQPKPYVKDTPVLALNFEEASLNNLLSYMETIHNIKFIPDDIVNTAKDAKGTTGHKITFRTNQTLTRKQSWDICINFLHIAGFDVVPMMEPGFYRLVSLTKANTEPIPTYIGVDCNILPDNDMIVRYVYFVRNIDPAKIQPILKTMQSGSAKLDVYAELKALIFTDRASSIKSIMHIVKELDRAALPEVLSVIKLKRANAKDVIDLYNSLKPSGTAQPQKAWEPNKKSNTLDYFPSDVTMLADARTNSLILLGVAKEVTKVEDFIKKHIDVAVDRDAPPLFTYRLQYTNAKDMTELLKQMTSYGATTEAGKYGGVRDGIKYFQKMSIIADTWSNSLIINATPEDYEVLKPLIDQLDRPQKQVGIEILFVSVKDVDLKTLGAQISGPNGQGSLVSGASPIGPTFFSGASAQTSGVAPGTNVVVTRGATGNNGDDFSIKSSLASLLGGNILNEVGSVLVTLGQPIWAVFKILKSITSTHIISNPFGVTSNNSTLTLVSGEERRQTAGIVISSSSVKATGLVPIQATLTVNITPQINEKNMINMNINIQNQQFVSGHNQTQGESRDLKQIVTQATVANGETLVLGGIMIENYASNVTGVPFLQNIPVVGWFFKSKTRTITRDHFLIFICPRILDPVENAAQVNHYTDYKLNELQDSIDLIDEADWFKNSKDPVQNWFFGSQSSSRSLQELRTGKQFATREAIDGKIDYNRLPARQKKLEQKRASKKKKKNKINNNNQEFLKPLNKKNTIWQGVAQGVGNAA